MPDDLDNPDWVNKLSASCHDLSEQYHNVLSVEEEATDRAIGFLTELASSSSGMGELAAWISGKSVKALHGTEFLLPALVRFIFQNRSALKLNSESLWLTKALKEIPGDYLKDLTNAELFKEIQALQNQLWTLKGKTARTESSTLGHRDDIVRALELKQSSKQSLETAVKKMKARLQRFSNSREVQQRCADLLSSQTTNKSLQNEINCLRGELDHWTEQKCLSARITKINSDQAQVEIHQSVAKAAQLMEQIQSELLPRLYALKECQTGFNQNSASRQTTSDILSKSDSTGPKVLQGGNKIEQNDHKIKTLLLHLLKSRSVSLQSSVSSQKESVCRATDSVFLANYEQDPRSNVDVPYIRKSYDEARRQVTALDSELVVLKKTREMLEQYKDKDNQGLETKFSAIESLEELKQQIEQTSQLLKQRKGDLAPQVASLKSRRQELQISELNVEAVGRDGIRSETRDLAQRELALVKEEIFQRQEDIRELEIKVEALRELSNSYSPDRIKENVRALKLEIKDLETEKRTLDQQEHVEKIESWKQVTRLLENFLAVSQETTESNNNHLEAEENATVLVID